MEGCDLEGLVIWFSRGGDSWCSGVDWFRVNDREIINDWDEEKVILVGDGGYWMLVCGWSEGLYTFVN